MPILHLGHRPPWLSFSLRGSRRIPHVSTGSRQGEVRYLGLVAGLPLGFSDYIIDPGATHGNKSTQDSAAYSRTKLAIHMVKKYSEAFPPLASLPRPGTLRCTPYFKPRAAQSTHPTLVMVVTPLSLHLSGLRERCFPPAHPPRPACAISPNRMVKAEPIASLPPTARSTAPLCGPLPPRGSRLPVARHFLPLVLLPPNPSPLFALIGIRTLPQLAA